jgi:diguanylate cyclase (GGDEF)-like protein
MSLRQFIVIFDSSEGEIPFITEEFGHNSGVNKIICKTLGDGAETISRYEPDLIIVRDNFDVDVVEICRQIREKTRFYRPILMVLSATEGLEKKLEILKAGADDFQSESTDKEELSLRIFAHLRRQREEFIDPVTGLSTATLSYRVLKRNIKVNANSEYALMYIDIDNFEPYREIYGHIAADKMLQTFTAIIKTSLNEDDFPGRVGNEDFVILTKPDKAEKISAFLSYSFDMVAGKFYTEEDSDRGYIILHGDEKAGRRISLVSVSIGIISNRHKRYESIEELVNDARNTHRLAKMRSGRAGSFWISDRPKLAGSELSQAAKRKILVVENDAALSYLLVTTLEMQGYSAESVNSFEQVFPMLETAPPNLILFDTTAENAEKELEMCRSIRKNSPGIRIIVSTADCNKEMVLDAGVDLYIPKPYELITLFGWINRFLNYEIPQ